MDLNLDGDLYPYFYIYSDSLLYFFNIQHAQYAQLNSHVICCYTLFVANRTSSACINMSKCYVNKTNNICIQIDAQKSIKPTPKSITIAKCLK